jgi:hypothetical protein
MHLSKDKIAYAIEHFNELLPYPAIDFAVFNVFQIHPRHNEEREAILSMRMEAVEHLFEAGLKRKKLGFELRNGIVRGDFGRSYWNLVEQLEKRGSYSLSRDTKDSIKMSFEGILETLKHETGKNLPAFTSKLLHWTFPNAFPMRDAESLKKMHLGGADYGRVTDFYLELGKELQMKMSELKKWLVAIDSESLPPGLRAPYSWVRVVDKWLWLPG